MTGGMTLQKRHLSAVVQLTTPVQTQPNASYGEFRKKNISCETIIAAVIFHIPSPQAVLESECTLLQPSGMMGPRAGAVWLQHWARGTGISPQSQRKDG